MPCIAEYSAPSSSLTLLVIREKVAEGIQQKCMLHLLVMPGAIGISYGMPRALRLRACALA